MQALIDKNEKTKELIRKRDESKRRKLQEQLEVSMRFKYSKNRFYRQPQRKQLNSTRNVNKTFNTAVRMEVSETNKFEK